MKNLFKAVLAVCAISLTTGVSAAIIADGKEWRQVTETVNFSWNDFSSVCSTSDGSCSGSLTNGTVGTVSFDGWTWASQGDMASLLQSLAGWDGPSTNDAITHLSSTNSPWAPLLFDALSFQPTSTTSAYRHVGGYTSIPFVADSTAYLTSVYDTIDGNYHDVAYTASSTGPNFTAAYYGGWFYRSTPATPSVPAPPTLALALVPALMMVAVRRKRFSH